MTTNHSDASFYFVRIRASVDDFVIIVVSLRRRRFDFIGRVRIDKSDHEILHTCFAPEYTIRNFQQRFICGREVDHVVFDLTETILDALGDFDFALTRQEFDCAHFAHVHTDRVGRAAEFGVDTRECGFRFLGSVIIRRSSISQKQRLSIRCLFVHCDAHVVNHVNDVFNLIWVDDVVRQVIIDLCICQVALFLAAGN